MSTPSEIFINGKKHIPAVDAFLNWSVSKSRFYEEFNAGNIKGVKIGRVFYVDEEAFLEYCQEMGYTRKPVKQVEVKEESNLERRVRLLEIDLADLRERVRYFATDFETPVRPVQASLLSEEAA